MGRSDYLTEILARKRLEIARRKRRGASTVDGADPSRGSRALAALARNEGATLNVVAELKFRSPSAGQIREWKPGEGVRVARAYEQAGAAVVSVLADGPGFDGSSLEVRRVASAIARPVLYKEFVLDPIQVDLAYAMGASLVLLLVRALSSDELARLSEAIRQRGMEPVVEAASEAEIDAALAMDAKIIGFNARDLATFRVDLDEAARLVERIPPDRTAVFMSGVRSKEDFDHVAATRADAVLIGEGLMRADDPGAALAALLRRG